MLVGGGIVAAILSLIFRYVSLKRQFLDAWAIGIAKAGSPLSISSC